MANTVVQKELYGIGISPLSIKNKKFAVDNEMVANKKIGLFGIYNEDTKAIVSEAYSERCKNHLDEVTKKCYQEGTIGAIYKISPDDQLVQMIESSKNIFTNQVQIDLGERPLHFIRLDIDYDYIDRETDSELSADDVEVTLNFSITKGKIKKSYSITDTLLNFNNFAYAVSYADIEAEEASGGSTPAPSEGTSDTPSTEEPKEEVVTTNEPAGGTYQLYINSLTIIPPIGFVDSNTVLAIDDVLMIIR